MEIEEDYKCSVVSPQMPVVSRKLVQLQKSFNSKKERSSVRSIKTQSSSSKNEINKHWQNCIYLEEIKYSEMQFSHTVVVTHKEIVQAVRQQVRKVKALTKLTLARDTKGNKKRFYGYISNKGESWENTGPFRKETGDMVTWDIEKAKIFKSFCCLGVPV